MKFKPLTNAIIEYLKSEVDGLKITAKDQSSKIVVLLLTLILVSIFGLTALLFANIGLAFIFGDMISEMNFFRVSSLSREVFNGLGFFAVATMYFAFFILFLLIRPIIKGAVVSKVDKAIKTTAQKNIDKLKS